MTDERWSRPTSEVIQMVDEPVTGRVDPSRVVWTVPDEGEVAWVIDPDRGDHVVVTAITGESVAITPALFAAVATAIGSVRRTAQ